MRLVEMLTGRDLNLGKPGRQTRRKGLLEMCIMSPELRTVATRIGDPIALDDWI